MKAVWCGTALALLLSGCGGFSSRGGYYKDDGPDERPPIDVATVPDAVPKIEPVSGFGNKSYRVFGVTYTPMADATGYRERGVASWYGKKFHGQPTSSREPYDMYAMTAAHKTLPLPSYARVRNLENGQSVVVRVNDRGPFLHDRLVDLSYAAATRLGILGTGTGLVEVEVITPNQPNPGLPLISTAAAAEPLPPRSVGAPRLSVQAGAFSSLENAARLRAQLERAGVTSIYTETGAADGLHRVRIGPLPDVAHGDRLLETLARAGIPNARIIVE